MLFGRYRTIASCAHCAINISCMNSEHLLFIIAQHLTLSRIDSLCLTQSFSLASTISFILSVCQSLVYSSTNSHRQLKMTVSEISFWNCLAKRLSSFVIVCNFVENVRVFFPSSSSSSHFLLLLMGFFHLFYLWMLFVPINMIPNKRINKERKNRL